MFVTYDSSVDALYVSFRERSAGDVSRPVRLDDRRLVNYAADGEPLGVELLGPREMGIDLTGLPRASEIASTLESLPRPGAAQQAV